MLHNSTTVQGVTLLSIATAVMFLHRIWRTGYRTTRPNMILDLQKYHTELCNFHFSAKLALNAPIYKEALLQDDRKGARYEF